MAIRVLRLSGAPRTRGEAYGESARDLIREGLERWLPALAQHRSTDPDEYLNRFLTETDLEESMRRFTPHLLEEISGIAAGANVPYAHVLAYCLVDEEQWFAGQNASSSAGQIQTFACSSVGRVGDELTVMGQTLDVPRRYDGVQVLLMIEHEDGVIALVTAAGNLGWSGCNSWGVGKCGNGLYELPFSPHGLPVQAVIRTVLERRTRDEAVARLREVPHATGQNYILGGPGAVTTFECSAAGVIELGDGATACHTNHPLAAKPDDRSLQRSPELLDNSKRRLSYLESHEDDLASAEGVLDVLADRTVPISRAEDRSMSIFGIGMELTAPLRSC